MDSPSPSSPAPDAAFSPGSTLVCANHPKRETLLRCNRCNKPICTDCAVPTPTGYRCRECISNQQKVFDTAQTTDLPIAFFISAGLSFLGSLAAGFIGFIVLFVAPGLGMLVVEAIRRAVKRRRSVMMTRVAGVGALLGSLPLLLIVLAMTLLSLAGGARLSLNSMSGLLWYGVYSFLITSAVYYRMK